MTPELFGKAGHFFFESGGDWAITLPETNIAPEIGHPKRKLIFKPSIFRGYVSFRDITSIYTPQRVHIWNLKNGPQSKKVKITFPSTSILERAPCFHVPRVFWSIYISKSTKMSREKASNRNMEALCTTRKAVQ